MTWFRSEITVVSNPVRSTTKPLGPAGAPRFIVRIPGKVESASGFGVKVMLNVLAVIVTVTGALFANPSLTINCTT